VPQIRPARFGARAFGIIEPCLVKTKNAETGFPSASPYRSLNVQPRAPLPALKQTTATDGPEIHTKTRKPKTIRPVHPRNFWSRSSSTKTSAQVVAPSQKVALLSRSHSMEHTESDTGKVRKREGLGVNEIKTMYHKEALPGQGQLRTHDPSNRYEPNEYRSNLP